MSLHQPVFRNEIYTPGLHRGLYFNMSQRSNRYKQRERARTSLSLDAAVADRITFVAWLVELRILADDTSQSQLPVAQARPHGLEAWWTLDEGELEVTTSHQSWPSWSPPRSAPRPATTSSGSTRASC